jgi:hypothetical protein
MGEPTEARNGNIRGRSREQHSRVGAESGTNKTLDHIVRVVLSILCELQRGQEEIRQQLAGRQKSHLTVEEFGQLVGRAPYTVRTWIRGERINAIRVAGSGPRGRLLIPREEIEKVITAGLGENVPAVAAK